MKKLPVLFISFALSIFLVNAQQTKHVCFDSSNFDLSVRPGDDFFKYANGGWLQKTVIPASKTSWGTTAVLNEQLLNNLKSLLEDASQHTKKDRLSQMLGDFYISGMDSAGIEKKGFQPIVSDLKRIDGIKTVDQFISEIATGRTKGIYSPLFPFYIEQDEKVASQYIPHIGQGGISLPDRDYYLKNDERSKNIRKEYRVYISDMFKLIGDDSVAANGNAQVLIDFETKLASAHFSKIELRDPVKTYNKLSVDDLSNKMKLMKWRKLLQEMSVTGQDSVVVVNPGFLIYADSLLAKTSVEDLKIYLQWYLLKNNASLLSDAFVKTSFKFTKVLSGQKENTPRWQKMSNMIDGRLGDMLGQLYVSGFFTPAAKKRMEILVDNLQKSFQNRIRNLSWMSDSTKQKAILKLNAITKKIGYPEKWKNYEGLQISKDNLVENIRNCASWNYQYDLKRLGKPVDKTEWGMTPPTVNAYYNPLLNEIAFPAGILQPPFFNFEADDAVNYGAIATVIGHEMTHGFDDKGKQFDADGNLKDWWLNVDAEKFEVVAKKIVEEYSRYVILDTIHLNGQLTVGENIADFGGLSIAYDAFKNTPQGKSDVKIDGLTPDQRFFLSWAQIWRNKTLPETRMRLNMTDPHSPAEFRCNIALKNMDAFYKAFNIQPTDKMYKPESERIKIW